MKNTLNIIKYIHILYNNIYTINCCIFVENYTDIRNFLYYLHFKSIRKTNIQNEEI